MFPTGRWFFSVISKDSFPLPGSRRHLHPVGGAGSGAEKEQLLSSCFLGIDMPHFCSLNGHEFEQTPWDGEGQGSLAVVQESDTTERQQQLLLTFLWWPSANHTVLPRIKRGWEMDSWWSNWFSAIALCYGRVSRTLYWTVCHLSHTHTHTHTHTNHYFSLIFPLTQGWQVRKAFYRRMVDEKGVVIKPILTMSC